MQAWRNFKNRLRLAWYREENRRLFVGIVIGFSLIVGIGIGVFRAWTTQEEPALTPNPVSREELEEVVQERVQNVIADLYPWVLDGPTQVVMVEPPPSVLPEPTEQRPEKESPSESVISFEHLIWPVQGEVATPFGWYRHPVYGDWRFNAGLEFTTSSDAVRTVLPGEVIKVTSSGLDTELVIDHGSGWVSTYRSIRGIQVGPGEIVKQNQNIALPESSGLVFFGLSHNGEPVNPQAFLH